MVKVDGMDIMEGVSGNFMIARLRDPGEFIETSLWTRYLDGEESGVSLVIGKLLSDPEGGEVKQAYRFDKMSGWDTTKVMILTPKRTSTINTIRLSRYFLMDTSFLPLNGLKQLLTVQFVKENTISRIVFKTHNRRTFHNTGCEISIEDSRGIFHN